MKKTQLTEIIRSVIREMIDESAAGEEAKRQGLEYMSFGRYGKDGQVTHISQGGKLVPKKDFKPDGIDRKAKHRATIAKARGPNASIPTRSVDAVAGYDPLTGRLQSRTAGPNREFQAQARDLRRTTGATSFDDPLIQGKGFHQAGDLGYTDVSDPSKRKAPFPRSAQRAFQKISAKAREGFGRVPKGTSMDTDEFMSRTGLSPAALKFAGTWNKQYGRDYARIPFAVNDDNTVTYIGG